MIINRLSTNSNLLNELIMVAKFETDTDYMRQRVCDIDEAIKALEIDNDDAHIEYVLKEKNLERFLVKF